MSTAYADVSGRFRPFVSSRIRAGLNPRDFRPHPHEYLLPAARADAAEQQRVLAHLYAGAAFDLLIEFAQQRGNGAGADVENATAAGATYVKVLAGCGVKAVGPVCEGEAEGFAARGHCAEIAVDRAEADLRAVLPNALVDLGGGGVVELHESLADDALLYAVTFCGLFCGLFCGHVDSLLDDG